MRKIAVAVVAGLLLASLAGPASAAKPAVRGILPTDARPHGHSLVDLATAYALWSFGTPEASNPVVAGRCEPSPMDPRIWFLPGSMGGDVAVACAVPQGAFVLVLVGGSIYSEVTGDATTEAELRALAEADVPSGAELVLDGRAATGLLDDGVTTRAFTLPADNLLGPDPGLTVARLIIAVAQPLSRGTHDLWASVEFADYDFEAGVDYTLIVH